MLGWQGSEVPNYIRALSQSLLLQPVENRNRPFLRKSKQLKKEANHQQNHLRVHLLPQTWNLWYEGSDDVICRLGKRAKSGLVQADLAKRRRFEEVLEQKRKECQLTKE